MEIFSKVVYTVYDDSFKYTIYRSADFISFIVCCEFDGDVSSDKYTESELLEFLPILNCHILNKL